MKTLRKIGFLLIAAFVVWFTGCEFLEFDDGGGGGGGGSSATIVGKWNSGSVEAYEFTSDWKVIVAGSDSGGITYLLNGNNISTWASDAQLGTASFSLSNNNNTLTLSNVGTSGLLAGTYTRAGTDGGGGGGGGGTILPSAPTGVTAYRNPSGSTTVTVSWNAVSGANGYRVYWSSTGSGTGTLDGSSNTTSFNSTNNSTTSTWYFSVSAVNSAGEGPRSSWVSVGPTGGGPTLPTAPTNVTAVRTSATSETATVSWSAVSGATSYRVYWFTTNSGSGTYEGTSNTTSFSSTGNTLGTTWYFSVSAVNSAGEGARSSWVMLTSPSTTMRNVTIDMYDSAGDGWDGNAALRIVVNGVQWSPNPRPSGSSARTTFDVYSGDFVQVYWISGPYQSENSFIIYYTNTPPSPAFTTSNNSSWSGSNALVFRLRGSMTNISNGTLLGSFTIP